MVAKSFDIPLSIHTRWCCGTNFWLHLMSASSWKQSRAGSNAISAGTRLNLTGMASVHALHLIESVQATQHVNAEVHTTLAVH